MNTDTLITKILDSSYLSKSHHGILDNIVRSIHSSKYITEKQANFALSIVKNYADVLKPDFPDLPYHLILPRWQHPFRVIEIFRDFYIEEEHLIVKFSYSETLRDLMHEVSKQLIVEYTSPGVYQFALSEYNIVVLYDALQGLNFEIDPCIVDYYETIISWNKSEYTNIFTIDNQPEIKDMLIKDIGEDGLNNALLMRDRSHLYSYVYETEIPNNTLAEYIANRSTPKIWIPSKVHSLVDLFKALVELKRFPLLILFNPQDKTEYYTHLININQALDEIGIKDEIGVYFRLQNTNSIGGSFNQFVANHKYNAPLTAATNVAMINKVPKFLCNSDWKPKTVVSIGDTVRYSKTGVYAISSCDLLIEYVKNESIMTSFLFK